MVQQSYREGVTVAKEEDEGPIDKCLGAAACKRALSGVGGEWAAAGRAEPEQQVLTVRCCGHW